MARGPGKYDALATMVREQADADCVVVIVINGRLGSGFSIQALADVKSGSGFPVHATAEVTDRLPALLRGVADDIEATLA